MVQADQFRVVLSNLVAGVKMDALSLSLKCNITFYVIPVLEFPFAAKSSLKLSAVSLDCFQELFLEIGSIDSRMELLHYFIRNGRQVEKQHAEIRLDIFVFVKVLDVLGPVGNHCADVVEPLDVVVIRQNIVPG